MCELCGNDCEVTPEQVDAYDAAIEQELLGCLYLFESLPAEMKTKTLRDEFTQMSMEECRSYVHQVNLQFGNPKQAVQL